jgi:hypothetical protein
LRERGTARREAEPENDEKGTAHHTEATSPRAACGKK